MSNPAPAAAPAAIKDPMRPVMCRVRKVRRETGDTFTLELDPPDVRAGFRFEPGQFNMLYAFGVGEAAISISGDPGRVDMLMHTTRRVGLVTGALGRLQEGSVLGVRGPFGVPWPIPEAHGCDLVLVAGGIGLAPLRPVLYQVMNNRARYGKVVLLYGARTPQDILFRRELESWRSHLDLDVYVSVDHAGVDWHGNVGVVTKLIRRAPFDPHQSIAMICGPEVMMKFTVMELDKRGLSRDRIYVSMERNMKCAVGFCGHCQFGPAFICRDGPVFRYDKIHEFLDVREV
jgi:NAD(P)H-flavin reductase